MKVSRGCVLALLLGLCCSAFAECDATVKVDVDHIADVKAKLACFATEVSTLQAEIADLKAHPTAPRINYRGVVAPDNPLDVATCKLKSIAEATKRGGQVVDQGDVWVDLKIGPNGIMVNCKTAATSFVFVAGPDHQAVLDLATAIRVQLLP